MNTRDPMIEPNDPRLTDYVLGELAPSEVAQIEAALKSSPELRAAVADIRACLLYTSPSPRDLSTSRMPSSA